MTRSSYLRVYQPLEDFPREEHERWLGQPDPAPAEPRPPLWLIYASLPSLDASHAMEGAFVRRVDGAIFVCPRRTRLRMLAGLLDFHSRLPDGVADAFVPEPEVRRAADELAALQRAGGALRTHILQANWHVPIRWFTAFADLDRILVEDRDGVRIRYEARLDEAIARVKRAVAVFEGASIDDSIVDLVKELHEWLRGFGRDGLVELDYATVARSFSDDELVEDRSAADLGACIDALEAGDAMEAMSLFAQLTERWSGARACEVVN